MLDRDTVATDADRRATVQRHIRADAERDLARRRRLRARIRPLVAAEAPFIDLFADCAPTHVVIRPVVNLMD